jgi:hypothetical protein
MHIQAVEVVSTSNPSNVRLAEQFCPQHLVNNNCYNFDGDVGSAWTTTIGLVANHASINRHTSHTSAAWERQMRTTIADARLQVHVTYTWRPFGIGGFDGHFIFTKKCAVNWDAKLLC